MGNCANHFICDHWVDGRVDGPATLEQAFDQVAAELKELLLRKQRDYGPANIQEAGVIGVVVRLNDKLARLRNLYGIRDGVVREPIHEAVDDSWRDAANYAIIGLLLLKGWWGLPMDERV